MNYNLNVLAGTQPEHKTYPALKKLLALISDERKNLILACTAIFINSSLTLTSPFLIGYAVDKYIVTKNFHGLLIIAAILLVMYLGALVTSYLQTKLMGGVGQRMLFTLRNSVFKKLLELPLAFFNQNKAGDLISRVNNDTDKINQFFSQSLMQFIGSIVTMIGAGIFLLCINWRLGAAALLPALLIFTFTRLVSPMLKRRNALNLKTVGGLSAEIQESLNNFRVIIAFNRRDYFRKRFAEANNENYTTAIGAGLANNVVLPVYGLFSSIAQLVVLAYGIYLISEGAFTIGLLVSFLSYANNFYNPLRQLAALWSSFQTAMAGWDRISQILDLESDLRLLPAGNTLAAPSIIEFSNVHFAYPDGKEVLHSMNFKLQAGKTYALIGPTGGGKTTTSYLMARLYDPTKGTVLLNGKDIRSYDPAERTKSIGFILQEPFLFSGTVRENILYGNDNYRDLPDEQLIAVIQQANLEGILTVFESGLDTPVTSGADSISLGQKQLIAFMRAVLRDPKVLILDEATANIDTVTEQLLDNILEKLPKETTRVIIAHRLNTIKTADEIYFVNAGAMIRAGSFDEAVAMLLHDKRES